MILQLSPSARTIEFFLLRHGCDTVEGGTLWAYHHALRSWTHLVGLPWEYSYIYIISCNPHSNLVTEGGRWGNWHSKRFCQKLHTRKGQLLYMNSIFWLQSLSSLMFYQLLNRCQHIWQGQQSSVNYWVPHCTIPNAFIHVRRFLLMVQDANTSISGTSKAQKLLKIPT